MTKEKKEQFRKIFREIPTETKLVLSSKTVVEDVLFGYAKDLDYESHAHSFIICDHDDKMKTLFSKEDWKELTKKPSLPPVDYEIGKELAKYMKDDLAQLREEVMRSLLKVNEIYDPMEHYFKEWIQITMRHLCNLYENPSAPLCRDQYEDWFTVNLFGNCFDFLMRHPKMSTDIKRTDAPSTASANRKNRAKKQKQRKLTGRKIDGIIHHPTYNMELGALEAARSFVNDGDRKLLIESFKMPKTLKDILVNMIRSNRCKCISWWPSVSYIFAITFSFLSDFLKFLKAIVRSQSLGFIEQKTPNDDDFKEEDLISESLDCFETPHKKKNPNKKTPALK
ncbi:unnamed protein product [Rhizophagus irregularis]|nr:unnamed protein product [Rhizophagus irregularis]